ncbi:MAG TPA: carbohydrate-binding protein [Vicinamibacterales bacterium]|nr:carbohydrate-binding protein [Vicinamibacterales bacterium]
MRPFRAAAELVVVVVALIVLSRFDDLSPRLLAAVPPTSSTPFSGAPAQIPGRIDVANFDNGGLNVAYADTSAGNAGGAYRATDVDLQASSLGGYNVGWVAPGEWLRYTVYVQASGAYTVRFNVASPVAGGTFHLEMNGVNVTGPLTIPNTGGWQAWQMVSATVSLQQGTQSATLVADSDGAGSFGNFGWLDVASAANSGPFGGTPATIPGSIEAVNFDAGPAGTAYTDKTPGNSGGAYRQTDVDIEASAGGGYNVGWVDPGEWLRYTVNVTQSGSYTAAFKVAASGQGGTFHLEMNGANVTGPLTVPNTGGWQNWQTITAPMSLTAGQQTARLVFDASGTVLGNFGRIDVRSVDAPPPAPASGPYSGSPAPLPGTIEAGTFDIGPSGTAWYDTTPGNSGGAFRSTDVDIEASADGGYDVGWTDIGEWMNYTVNVATAGTYSITLRVASPQSGRSLHVGFNRASNVWTQLFVPNTGGWQNWTTVTVPATLGAGVQQLTVYFDTGGVNLGRIAVTSASAPPPPPPSGTPMSASVWLTDHAGTKRLAPQASASFAAGTGDSSLPTIDVDEAVRYQRIEGFGGSITDSSAWLLSQLSAGQRSSAMTALFDRQAGIGISFLRQPIGSSDFSLSAYTFDDIDPFGTDYGLASFSIDHDRQYILPLLRQALSINPALKIMASPWTPPAWMKTEGSLQAGSLRYTAYDAYANYLVKFLQAYASEGVPVESLTVQNEPLTTPPYPSMYMVADDQARFIGQNLGPALARTGLTTRIFAWDHNWDTAYPFTVLGNAAARSYVSGVSFHCYGGTPAAMSDQHFAYPNVEVAMTECGDSSRATFGDKLTYDVRTSIIGSLRNWASRVVKWNVALDPNGGPKLYAGACRNCAGMLSVNASTGAVTFNEDYYAIGHASRFIRPGAFRVSSTEYGLGGIENVAALNPDGSVVLLAINSGDYPQTFQIRTRGTTLKYVLDSGSAATFVWTPQ